jgi:hypothetical protein
MLPLTKTCKEGVVRMIINGKEYPMWSEFLEHKNEWIGGTLHDFGDDSSLKVLEAARKAAIPFFLPVLGCDVP